jgi:rare lipoprotein A
MGRSAPLVTAGVLLLLSGGCADHARQAPSVAADQAVPAAPPAAAADRYVRETGTASWYGRELQGRRSANGEVFDMNVMTAAHRTLPLGTVLRVTSLNNEVSAEVTVTDRGPFLAGRAIELSYGAAKALGFLSQGTAQVRFETLGPVAAGGTFTVHAAAYAEEENAKLLRERLWQRYETVNIVVSETNLGRLYRVRVGNYPSEEKAERIAAKLKLDGLEPVVLRKD